MPSNYELRREYALDQALAAGKFTAARRAFWSQRYDADPAATAQVLAALAPAVAEQPPYPPELFPELARQQPRRRPATTALASAAAAAPPDRDFELSDEQVAAWSRQLFPDAALAGSAYRRITRAND